MDAPICDHVWRIVNPRDMDKFDKNMFTMVMHFLYVYKKNNGSIPLPNQTVPEETIMSIDPDNYFKMKQQMIQMRTNQAPMNAPNPSPQQQ